MRLALDVASALSTGPTCAQCVPSGAYRSNFLRVVASGAALLPVLATPARCLAKLGRDSRKRTATDEG
jgi:hypothetical protein